TVVGHWSQLGTNSNTCTTGDLGGNGTCIVLFPSRKRSGTSVNMTVVSVTRAGRTYDRTLNHDVDGSSNGTTIKVNRPEARAHAGRSCAPACAPAARAGAPATQRARWRPRPARTC